MWVEVNQYEPEPFNHGNSSVELYKIEGDHLNQILEILEKGWGISNPFSISVFKRNNTYSNTYNIDLGTKHLVLKVSNINNENDLQFNYQVEKHGLLKGLPIPKTLRTLTNNTFFKFDSRYCTVQERITGKLFGGSLDELKESARVHAKFINSYLDFTDREYAKTRNRSLEYDPQTWLKIKEKCNIGTSVFDSKAMEIINEIDRDTSRFNFNTEGLRKSIGHFDWHPHNLLFDNNQLVGILDFDLLRFDFIASDIALGMHKLSRIFGSKTEEKQDIGNSIASRSKSYLDEFQSVFKLTNQESDSLKPLLYNELRKKIYYILKKHYLNNDTSSDFDIEKQYLQLKEIEILSF